jgi:hypothetical protein
MCSFSQLYVLDGVQIWGLWERQIKVNLFRINQLAYLPYFSVPIPSISATIHPSAAGQPGTSSQMGADTSKQQIEEEDDEEEQRPLELSEKVPLEEARDANYIFGEIPILAPLHPRKN